MAIPVLQETKGIATQASSVCSDCYRLRTVSYISFTELEGTQYTIRSWRSSLHTRLAVASPPSAHQSCARSTDIKKNKRLKVSYQIVWKIGKVCIARAPSFCPAKCFHHRLYFVCSQLTEHLEQFNFIIRVNNNSLN